MVFVGGGVIALEFGHVYARAGAKVTILEVLPQLLPAMDADAVARVHAESERIGIGVKTGVKVKRIEPAHGRLRVIFEHDGAEQRSRPIGSSTAPGASPMSTRSISTPARSARRGRIEIDDHLRSASNPAVHVCGDVLSSSPQLSPIATYEGQIVGRNIVEGPEAKPDYASIPSCVYTVPALASVGLTEAEARQSSATRSRSTATTCAIGCPRGPTTSRSPGPR